MYDNLIVFITGPTCVGKTNLSILLANYFPIEIINMDSSMIYKYMDIGTGKPSLYLRSLVKHNLIDILDPSFQYSVWDFCISSFSIVLKCLKNKKIPVFVGGSMMYMWYFQNFFNFFKLVLQNKVYFNTSCLTCLDRSFYFFCRDKLYNINFFNYLNLSIFSFKFINIFLIPFDEYLFYKNLEHRLSNMLDDGFIDEVYYLYSRKDLNINLQSIKSIGYKDIWLYLDNRISISDAITSTLSSSVELANKQLKWMKKWKNDVYYIENKENDLIKKSVNVINKYLY